ncbi:copper homeostasis protein CutC-like isoform X3 [Portunus trituberculatus]|uniref:copper homeostasis protein CutC-like isoform X3 n=1 Tax=Portunus trituberculatus TaxID=210409 RepID=UPI001E1CF6F9|nr:copper homeostasis protein CutC-like isoform X3 [Portunus trituberculatus]
MANRRMGEKKLEICVDSLDSAIAAMKGGADRIELCSALSEGGLTPTLGLLRAVQKHNSRHIEIFCMVRPRGGPMVYSKGEAQIIMDDAASLKKGGADGLVFGALNIAGTIHQDLSKQFIQVADGLPCTFHRAFDLVQDPLGELENLVQLGYQRILTSGGKPTALEGCDVLKKLTNAAGGRITIMAGAGVKSSNVVDIIQRTGVSECHASAKICRVFECKNAEEVRMGTSNDNVVFVTNEEEVHAIKLAIGKT